MHVSVENVSDIKKRLTITIPKETIQAEYNKVINKFAKNAQIKGFSRPEKIPKAYLEKRFQNDIYHDVLEKIINHSLQAALSENNLNPVTRPDIASQPFKADQAFEFVASFEILPKIDTIHFKMDKIEKLNVTITEQDAEEAIIQICKQHGTREKVSRPVQAADKLVLDITIASEGEETKTLTNAAVEMGSEKVFVGFDEGLLGSVVGEEKQLSLHYIDKHSDKKLAGKPVTLTVKINEIYESKPKELTEAFIKELGIESGAKADLIKDIIKTLEEEKNKALNQHLQNQIFPELVEQNPLEVPETLVQKEMQSLHKQLYPDHPDEKHEHTEEETELLKNRASNNIRLSLLLDAYAKQNKITVDPSKIVERIQQIASFFEHPKEVFQHIVNQEIKNVEFQLIQEHVIKKLAETIPSEEKSITYAELKSIRI